ncbi:MAG TPA: hypothetical protein VIY48_07755 [Candidatus Paceibacterota bacterium]
MKIAIVLLVIALLIVFFGWWLERHAPEGWEDNTGFHYGRRE